MLLLCLFLSQEQNTSETQAKQRGGLQATIDNLTAQLVSAEESMLNKQEEMKALSRRVDELKLQNEQVCLYQAQVRQYTVKPALKTTCI